jgi:tRNA (cytidine56-2'-O)-methyltransferase
VGRDIRVTTHLGLVARAFGAKGMYYSGDRDIDVESSISKVNLRWGGDFIVKYIDKPLSLVKNWGNRGVRVHLTMYGLPIDEVIRDIRYMDKDVLVIVGGAKVPGVYYSISDYNVSVTNQPHSEIAALAIFLDRYYMGKELDLEFSGGKFKIVPSDKGKKILRRE